MDKEDKKEIVGMFEYISEKMDNRFNEIDNRFNEIDNRFNEIDNRFDKIDNRFDKMDNRFDKMDNRFINLENRMETGFLEVRNDIKSLRTDLDLVEEKTENNAGFSKEIDTLFEEVKNIKEHIGLKESH